MDGLLERTEKASEKSQFEITIEFATDQLSHGLGKYTDVLEKLTGFRGLWSVTHFGLHFCNRRQISRDNQLLSDSRHGIEV